MRKRAKPADSVRSSSEAPAYTALTSAEISTVKASRLVGTELIHKRLELIKELSPRASRVVALAPGADALALPIVKSWWDEVRNAAQALGMLARYAALDLDSAHWDGQFAGFAREPGTVVSPIESPFLLQKAELLAQLALRHQLPAVYAFSQHVQAGGLCSYGVSSKYISTRSASYVSRILRGAKAGEPTVAGCAPLALRGRSGLPAKDIRPPGSRR